MPTAINPPFQNPIAAAIAIAAVLCGPAQAQRVGPPVSLATVEKGTCDLNLSPHAPIPQAPSFLVVSYKPGSGTESLAADVVTSSGSPEFDQEILRRLRTCTFSYAATAPRGTTGLLLLPVREGLGVRPPSVGASSPLPSCTPNDDGYPTKARREDRSGSVSVRIVGTESGNLARIELSVSSGQIDFDQAGLTRAANCAKAGAKPGFSDLTFRWSLQ
jgi:TonB family protein